MCLFVCLFVLLFCCFVAVPCCAVLLRCVAVLCCVVLCCVGRLVVRLFARLSVCLCLRVNVFVDLFVRWLGWLFMFVYV